MARDGASRQSALENTLKRIDAGKRRKCSVNAKPHKAIRVMIVSSGTSVQTLKLCRRHAARVLSELQPRYSVVVREAHGDNKKIALLEEGPFIAMDAKQYVLRPWAFLILKLLRNSEARTWLQQCPQPTSGNTSFRSSLSRMSSTSLQSSLLNYMSLGQQLLEIMQDNSQETVAAEYMYCCRKPCAAASRAASPASETTRSAGPNLEGFVSESKAQVRHSCKHDQQTENS